MWLYAFGASAIALFVGIFVYRGKKIEDQQKTIDEQTQVAEVTKKYYDNKTKIQEFEKQNSVEAEKAKHADKIDNVSDGNYSL